MARPAHTASDLSHHFADLDEVRLHYVEAGEGDLVVLLHGFPEFWYSWRHQIAALARAGYRVVAVDMRGYNLSSKPRGSRRYRVERLARDLAEFISALGAERAVVCGHDWGGAVAWTFAMLHPELLDRLVVLSCPHPRRFLRGLGTLRQLRKSWYMLFFQLPWLPEIALRRNEHALLRAIFRRGFEAESAFSENDVEAYVRAADHPGALTAALNYYRALLRRDPRGLLRTFTPIRRPTLVLWGDRDPFLGAELSEPEPDWVPGAEVEVLPGAGHWLMVERPDHVNRLILDFLARTSGAYAPTATPAGP